MLFLRLRAGRGRRRPVDRRAVTPGHVADRPCRRLPALRPGRRRRPGRGPGRAGRPPTPRRPSTPTALRRGPAASPADGPVVVVVGRPSLAEDGELVAEAAQVAGRRLPGARFLPALRRGNVHGRPRHGAGPGRPARAGLPRRRPGVVRRGLGIGAGGRGPRHGRDPGPRRPATSAEGAPVGALVLLGGDPLADFPDRRLARGRSRAPSSSWPWPRLRARPRARRRGPAGRRGPRAAGHHHQHRGPDQPAGPEAGAARPGLARLDDRRASWPSTSARDLGFDSVGDVWDEIERLAPVPPRDHPGRARRPGAADGVVAPLAAASRCPGPPPRRRSTPSPCPGWSRSSARAPPPRAGLAESPNAGAPTDRPGDADADAGGRPPGRRWPVPPTSTCPTCPPPTATRSAWWPPGVLYDDGSRGRWPSRRWPAWWARRALRANPHDLDGLGVADGGDGAAAFGHGHGGRARRARPVAAAPRWWPPTSTCRWATGRVGRPHRPGLPGGRAADGVAVTPSPTCCTRCSPTDPLYDNGRGLGGAAHRPRSRCWWSSAP